MDKYIHAFWHIPGNSYGTLEKIWNYFGDFRKAWELASERDLLRCGLTPKFVELVLAGRVKIDLAASMERLWSADIFLIGRESEEYPENFVNIDKPPFLIYRKGRKLSELGRRVAIVGMRKSTMAGEKIAYGLSRQLAEKKIVVVSGLAFGIDASAHTGSVSAKGQTIGVLASGINRITPTSHYALARKILEEGGSIISEYPITSPGMKHQFIERNRLISALAETVIVVEAAERSGSLITARHALDQGKNILAFPGDPGRVQSKGCNNLIKKGEAHLVDSVSDVMMHLQLQGMTIEKNLLSGLDSEERKLIGLIRSGKNKNEQIYSETGEEPGDVSARLGKLEIDGLIEKSGLESWKIAN